MERFIPYEKLSKKEKRKRDLERRGSWNGLSPVTRRGEDPGKYNRSKARQWKKEESTGRAFALPKNILLRAKNVARRAPAW